MLQYFCNQSSSYTICVYLRMLVNFRRMIIYRTQYLFIRFVRRNYSMYLENLQQ
jgi:hypothetical protein